MSRAPPTQSLCEMSLWPKASVVTPSSKIHLIVKSVQACFVNFDCPQEVVGGAKCSKFVVIGFQGLEDVKKSLVLNMFLM